MGDVLYSHRRTAVNLKLLFIQIDFTLILTFFLLSMLQSPLNNELRAYVGLQWLVQLFWST